MNKLIILAATLVAFSAGSALAKPETKNTMASAASATDPKATKTSAAPKYDCTKKGNANKTACKAQGAGTGAAPMTAAEFNAKPKKLSTSDAKKELESVQASPAVTPEPAKKKGLLGGLFHPGAPKPNAPESPAAPPAAPSQSTKAMSSGGHPHCSKGKPCGNSCISLNKTCHK